MSAHRSISRRQFMKSASAAAFGSTLLMRGGAAAAPSQAGKSRVVLIRDLNVLDENGQLKAAAVQEMLDAGITALTGKPDAPSAWKTLVHPGDVVGLKNNRWPYLRTTPEVEGGLKKRILEAGVKEADFAVDDLGVLKNPVFLRSTALINARPIPWRRDAGCTRTRSTSALTKP